MQPCITANTLCRVAVSGLLALVVVMALLSSACAAEQGCLIRVGLYQDPPSLWIDEQGQVKGFFADLLNHVAERESWNLSYVSGSWCELIQWLEEGKVDLLPAVYPDQYGIAMSQAQKNPTSKAMSLTPREREVLQLFAEGHSTREIAEKLFLSVKTIEAHRAQIMKKLNTNSVAELTKYAIREGLTTL